jgi:lysophospholipase L1-like esterase
MSLMLKQIAEQPSAPEKTIREERNKIAQIGSCLHLRASCLVVLVALLYISGLAFGQQLTPQKTEDGTNWYDILTLGLDGKGWTSTKHPFDRLPSDAEGKVREPVWKLSQDSAGLSVRFVTNATKISARWTLRRANLALPHMPASGVSGVDLYVRIGGQWHWLGNGKPDKPTYSQILVANLPPGEREYLLYLPLYNGVDSVELGLPPEAVLRKAPATTPRQKPIVFYGTSIVQGAAASRPGMAYPAILGRRLNYPIVNLGFSGNGKMEPEVAKLLAELDPEIYVIDALPNLEPADVKERAELMVKTIRVAHPATPIVLVENIIYEDAILEQVKRKKVIEKNAALRVAYAELRKQGVKQLYYLKADGILGADGEATVDGTHPNDLGFVRMAEAFEPLLRQLLWPHQGKSKIRTQNRLQY